VLYPTNVLINLQSKWYMTFLKAVSSSIVSFANAVKVAAEIAMKSWQRKWDQEVTGSYTRQC